MLSQPGELWGDTDVVQSRRGFTLTEIMIVIAIIGIIVAIAVPAFLRARERSRATTCQENLQKIDTAKEQYALEFKLTNGQVIADETDLVGNSKYLKRFPSCPAGGTYTFNAVGQTPTCSLESGTGYNAMHKLLPTNDSVPIS
jgi:prepilin-type N-terminal cleavage/methylation domain-containing protein